MDDTERPGSLLSRRALFLAGAAATLLGLAGCPGGEQDDEDDEDEDDD